MITAPNAPSRLSGILRTMSVLCAASLAACACAEAAPSAVPAVQSAAAPKDCSTGRAPVVVSVTVTEASAADVSCAPPDAKLYTLTLLALALE